MDIRAITQSGCNYIRIPVRRGLGPFFERPLLGDEQSFGAAGKLEGNWIEVEERQPGFFELVRNNMTDPENPDLDIFRWDAEVEDLDKRSDAAYRGMSEHLRWEDVDMSLNQTDDLSSSFRSPSVARLREALTHVVFCTWDRLEI